jgi:hypothetical protein
VLQPTALASTLGGVGPVLLAGAVFALTWGIARRKPELLWSVAAAGIVVGLLFVMGSESAPREGSGEGAAALDVFGELINFFCGIGLLVSAVVSVVAAYIVRRRADAPGTR